MNQKQMIIVVAVVILLAGYVLAFGVPDLPTLGKAEQPARVIQVCTSETPPGVDCWMPLSPVTICNPGQCPDENRP